MVSGFHGFIQIGIAIGIDYLTTEHTGWHCSGFYPQIYTDYADFLGHRSGFFGTPEGIPDFHEVSCLSWFHPNRYRYRDRYRDRLPHTLTPSHPHSLTASHPHSLTPSQPNTLTPSQPLRLRAPPASQYAPQCGARTPRQRRGTPPRPCWRDRRRPPADRSSGPR